MGARTKLLFIKALHTVVWAFFVAVIGYVLYCGIANRLSRYTWLAGGLVVGEGVVLLVFKRHCPLTLLARRYSASTQDNFDIFLPNWLARHNQLIFTSIYGIALLLLGYRLMQGHDKKNTHCHDQKRASTAGGYGPGATHFRHCGRAGSANPMRSSS